jgi:hypothetical protein
MSRSPTFDETYSDLIAVCKAAQRGLYDLGKIRGRNDLQSDEDLRQLVLSTSKAVINHLPCLQLEHDAVEEADSRYGHVLNTLEDAEGLECTDQALAGHCPDCKEPCDVRDERGAV